MPVTKWFSVRYKFTALLLINLFTISLILGSSLLGFQEINGQPSSCAIIGKPVDISTLLPSVTPSTTHGPFLVIGPEVNTGIQVKKGDQLRVTSSGKVDFGGSFGGVGAPKLDANGDCSKTPSDFPAPTLAKNSLIVKINETFLQGGTDRILNASTNGFVVLAANDGQPGDNSPNGGWNVRITPLIKNHFPANLDPTIVIDGDNNTIASNHFIPIPVNQIEGEGTLSKEFKIDVSVTNIKQIRNQMDDIQSFECRLVKVGISEETSSSVNWPCSSINGNRVDLNGKITLNSSPFPNRVFYKSPESGFYFLQIRAKDTTQQFSSFSTTGLWFVNDLNTTIKDVVDGSGYSLMQPVPVLCPFVYIHHPVCNIPIKAQTPSRDATFTFEGSNIVTRYDPIFTCKVFKEYRGGYTNLVRSITDCKSPIAFKGLEPGKYEFQVTMATKNGNNGNGYLQNLQTNPPASFDWTILP